MAHSLIIAHSRIIVALCGNWAHNATQRYLFSATDNQPIATCLISNKRYVYLPPEKGKEEVSTYRYE